MTSAQPSRPMRGRLPALRTAAAAALVIAAGAAGAWWLLRERTLYAQLAAIVPERSIAPRTSLGVPYRPCPFELPDGMVPQADCGGRHLRMDSDAAEDLVIRVKRLVDGGRDADALRAWAMIKLLGIGLDEPRPAEAIEHLRAALSLVAGDSAAVMADIAASYLVLAGQEQSEAALIEALDWSRRALDIDPHLPAALFNRALASEALAADFTAKDTWGAYLKASAAPGAWAYLFADGADPWRADAQERLRTITRRVPPQTPAFDANQRQLAVFAAAHPQQAREFGWDALLPEWGKALLAGNRARADTMLRAAEILGSSLVARGGDASLADQVSELRALLAGGIGVRDAAEAHVLDGELRRARNMSDPYRADTVLAVLRTVRVPQPQKIWIGLNEAATELDQGRQTRARELLDSLDLLIDTVRYPAAHARASLLRGTLLTHAGRHADAINAYMVAEAVYGRLGEETGRGSACAYIADIAALLGDRATADKWLLRASTILRRYRASSSRHNSMRLISEAAWHLGLPGAMRDLADEDVAIASAFGNSGFVDEAKLSRATLLAAIGRTREALREVEVVRPRGRRIAAGMHGFLDMRAAYVRALVQLESAPDSVAETVQTLIDFTTQAAWPMRGYAIRARANLATGDTAGARADLDSVFSALERGRGGIGGASQRDIAEGDVRASIQQLMLVLLAAGRDREALEYLERGNAALSSVELAESRLSARIPPGRVVVRPVLIGDTLVVWTLEGDRISVARSVVSARALKALIGDVDTALGRPWNIDAQLSRLYATLIEPVEARLGGAGTELVFVYDAALAGVPFAALPDRRRRPLGITHVWHRALTVHAAAQVPNRSLPNSVVFVAPAWDPARNPVLAPLPQARNEVATAASFYPRPQATTLTDSVTPAQFEQALPRYSVAHFAGHAVVDNLRPERSYLVLAGDANRPDGRLTAEAVEKLRLGNLDLVVLSACTTLGGDEGSSGFTGLSGAFLGAGARGVVGTLWKVDDDKARALMTVFHREYALHGDPARALHTAQTEMWRNARRQGASDNSWAAFQYVHR